MTTAQVLIACNATLMEWHPGPAPRNMHHFARPKGSLGRTLCEDTWLNTAIFGHDYEWSPVGEPQPLKLVPIWPSVERMNAWYIAKGLTPPPT